MANPIRIFSGNLWQGRADPDGLIDLIRRHRIDVFAAQELGFENAEAISSELPFGRLEPNADFMGMGVALRRPAKTERVALPFRDARRALLEPGEWAGLERAVCLVNVHFQAPHTLRPFPSFWLRRRQVRALERFLIETPSPARCVLGDYNATPAWPLYRRLSRHLEDAALHSARKEGRRVEPTWGPRPDSRRLLRIDHAMVRGLEVEGFRVVRIPGSDHSGILFDCSPRSAAGPPEDARDAPADSPASSTPAGQAASGPPSAPAG